MKKNYYLNNIKDIKITIKKQCIIFLKGDLGAGKTTFSKYIINEILGIKEEVKSPTYIYYNKYNLSNLKELYHFDLYKLQNYDEFFAIGGEDIFDNNTGIILVEWPELIELYYKPDILINLKRTDNEGEREIEVISFF